MRTVEDPTDPLGQLVSCEQPVGLDHLALAMDPLGLYRVEPRALLGQKAYDDPHSRDAVFDFSVMRGNPGAHLFGSVPASVVPDQNPYPLARSFELLGAPRKEAGGYPAYRTPVHEAQPHLLKLRQVKPVAGDGLRIGVIFSNRLFDQAQGLSGIAPTVESRSRQPAPPGLVQETHHPTEATFGQADQSVAPPFFLAYSGSGLVIQRLARSQRTPNRAKVARAVSPVTRSFVRPPANVISAARSSVHRLVSLPNFLGLWCSISRKASACSGSKALWTVCGCLEPG